MVDCKYGGKYKGLEIMKNNFGFNIPKTYVISINDMTNLFGINININDIDDIKLNSFIENFINYIPLNIDGYIVRSSSCLEGFNESLLELSGVYKSVTVNNKIDIFNAIKEIIKYNFSDHIKYIHKKYNYEYGSLIPLIVQPLIKGDYAGVLICEDGIITVDYTKNYNFGITSGKNDNISSFKYDLNFNKIIKGLNDFKFEKLLEISRVLKKYYNNYTIEFSLNSDLVTILQFKSLNDNLRKKDYSEIYNNIIMMMNDLGFGINDFAILENDAFLFYNYLGIRQNESENIEHIRILLLNNKFGNEYIKVKDSKDNFIHPSSKISQNIISKVYEELNLTFLFIKMDKNSLSNYYIYNIKNDISNKVNNLNFFIEDFDDIKSLSESIFFINRLNNENYIETYNGFKHKYINLKLIILKNEVQNDRRLLKILKKHIKNISFNINLIKKSKNIYINKSIKTNNNIISGDLLDIYGGNKNYIACLNITDCSKLKLNNKKIAFICNDFEPSWIPYLDYIDLIITKRPYRSSHGVAICKEFSKKLIYNCRNNYLIKNKDLIEVNLDLGFINIL